MTTLSLKPGEQPNPDDVIWNDTCNVQYSASVITFVGFAAPLLEVPPPLRLHTVLAPQRRTVSLVVPPVAALSTELSSETGAVLPIMAPQLHPHCPMTRGLLLSNAGARPQGSSARSPQSLSAGRWIEQMIELFKPYYWTSCIHWLCITVDDTFWPSSTKMKPKYSG